MKRLLLIICIASLLVWIGNDELKQYIRTLIFDDEIEKTLGEDTLFAQANGILNKAITEVIDYTPTLDNHNVIENQPPLVKNSGSTTANKIEVMNAKAIDGDTLAGTVYLDDLLSQGFSMDDLSKMEMVGDKVSIKVRYLLIDTPESVDPDIPKPQPYSIAAKKRNAALLGGGQITIQFDKGEKIDKFGRLLCYVFVNQNMIQETLVKEGYARVAFVQEPNTTFLPDLKNAETHAKNNELNIWSENGYVTEYGFEQ